MITLSCSALVLLGLLLGTVIASSNYPPKVSEFLEKVKALKEKESAENDGYSGYWFTNLVCIEEKDVPSEEHQITIKQLPDLAEKALGDFKTKGITIIKELINEYYEKLLKGDETYHYQLIRALDKFINDKLAAEMISDNWLVKNGRSIKGAVELLDSLCGVSVDKKDAASAKEALKDLNYNPIEDQHENIWFYLTYCKIRKEKFQIPINLPLLASVLSHQTNILELTNQNIFTKMSLNILKAENSIQALSEIPLPNGIVTGTVPTFRLLTLKNAEEIIQSIPIKSAEHMYFVFIFGVNIGPEVPTNAMKVAHYEMDKLTKLAGWIEQLQNDKGIDSFNKYLWTKHQIRVPYLNLKELFGNNQLDGNYAKKIAKDDFVTLELIDLAIAQQNELRNEKPKSITGMFYNFECQTPAFYFNNYCAWDCAAIKDFRSLLSHFIKSMAEASKNGKPKELLEKYLGYTYDGDNGLFDFEPSFDVLKNQYKLYEKAYNELAQSTFKNYLPFDKTEICRDASVTYHPNLDLEYCIEDLKSILISKHGHSIRQRIPELKLPRHPRKFHRSGKPETTLEVNLLCNKFYPLIGNGISSWYVDFMFQVDYRAISSVSTTNPLVNTPKLGLEKFEKLAACKKDTLWKHLIIKYLELIAKKRPLEISSVNAFMEKLNVKIRELVEKSQLPRIAIALFNSLDFGRLTAERLEDIMRDALLDDLELPVALLSQFLKVHFAEGIFKWNVFCSNLDQKLLSTTEMELLKEAFCSKTDPKLASVNGLKILKEMKSIFNVERDNDYHLKEYKYYHQAYKHHLKKYEAYAKKVSGNYDRIQKYSRLVSRFMGQLEGIKKLLKGLGKNFFDSSADFFELFSRLLVKKSPVLIHDTVESNTLPNEFEIKEKSGPHHIGMSNNLPNESHPTNTVELELRREINICIDALGKITKEFLELLK